MRISVVSEKEARAEHGASFLTKLVERIAPHAIVPVSNFHVGAAGLPLANSIHAEQFVFCLMAHHSEDLVELAVNYAPCGHCRQFLKEAKSCDGVVIRITSSNVVSTLPALLPSSFGPRDLGRDVCMFERKSHGAVLENPRRDSLIEDALTCLNSHCHAPYSGSLAAVGIALNDSVCVSGAYIESAAYNPSLPPGQCALINLVASNRRFEEIIRVVLLEVRSSTVSHFDQTVALMKAIKVPCAVEVVYVNLPSQSKM